MDAVQRQTGNNIVKLAKLLASKNLLLKIYFD